MDGRQQRATPDEAAQYIRFALSQLGERNAHHEFEHLCRHLTRKRICPNIIPSTGPVSAGGDKGIDFESYPVIGTETERDSSSFFGRAAEDPTIFACSLRKDFATKISQDVRKVSGQGDKANVVYFSNQPIPKSRQAELISTVWTDFAIRLRIFDCHAISELLADPEVFWIAQRYLSIPSDFLLRETEGSPEWYQTALATEIDQADLTAAAFFGTKDALRYATNNPDHNSDLPVLIAKLRMFRGHPFSVIRRKAIYEEFVASLRGLGVVEGTGPDLQEYFKEITTLVDVAELEDASCLLDFAYGSIARSLLSFPIETLIEWRTELSAHVDALLSQDISDGRRGALLEVKGYLALGLWPEPHEKGETSSYKIWRTEKASRAVSIWREMLRGLRDVPLFPLERFANRLSSFVVFLSQVDGFEDLVRETDDLLRTRFGNYKVAEKAMQRAINLQKAGRRLDAIDELHGARIGFFGREKIYGTVLASLQLAQWYEEAGLFLAAKYFALGGAYAALNIDEEEIKHLVPSGLELAASSDYAAGASLLLFVSTYAYLYTCREFGRPKPDAQQGQEEPDRVLFHLLLTTYAASLLDPSLGEFLIGGFLKPWDVDDIYMELLPTMRKSYGATGSFAEFAKAAAKENIGPPFCDAGGTRTVAWQQLGIHWTVNWATEYSTNICGEAFVALLQILLCDLRRAELSILPTEVYVTLRVHKGKLSMQQLPDNTRVRLDVSLPEDSAGLSRNSIESSPDVQAVTVTVLALVTALPPNEFLKAYEERLKLGLGSKFAIGASYESLFRQFYSPDIFADLYEIGAALRARTDVPAVETDAGLSGPTGLHPQYSSSRAAKDIRNRYERILKLISFTLRRLLGRVEFRRTVSSLRAKGWKDWHILTAMMNVRLNHIVSTRVPQGGSLDAFKRAFGELTSRDETETDPAAPEEMFSEKQLEMALHGAQLSYLRQLGFDCGQRTPNFGGVDKLLRRFRYWEDDIPHEDPFVFEEQASEREPDEGPPRIQSGAAPTEKGV